MDNSSHLKNLRKCSLQLFYRFSMTSGHDFMDKIAKLKHEFHPSERTWDEIREEWFVSASDRNRERLLKVFEDDRQMFVKIDNQARLF